MDKKLQIAKKFLAEYQQKVGWWKNSLLTDKDNYAGEMLKNSAEMHQKWIDEDSVLSEALEKYIYEIEMQIKQGEEHDAEEAEAERLADNEQEHAQEMRAQYEEELRSEGTDN